MIAYSILLKQERSHSPPKKARTQATHVQEGEHVREKLELTIAMSHAPHVPCCTLLLLMIRWGSGVRATGVPDLEETVRSGPH